MVSKKVTIELTETQAGAVTEDYRGKHGLKQERIKVYDNRENECPPSSCGAENPG